MILSSISHQNALLDLAVKHDLKKIKQKISSEIIESIKGGGGYANILLRSAIKEKKQPYVWPEKLKDLPPIDLFLELRDMHLEGAKITDFNGLNLKSLVWEDTDIDDDIDDQGLEALVQQFPNLEELTISSDKITDKGLLALKTLPLRKLELINCKLVTKEGYIAFFEEMQRLDKRQHFVLDSYKYGKFETYVPWSHCEIVFFLV